MDLETGCYYHLYNRSNNCERLFRNTDNYLYFLDNFRNRFEDLLSVFAYCLMPTHFHFLIKVETREIDQLKQHIGIQLSAYTKALNKALGRHGSLFQQHTKAKLIDDQAYLIRLLSYIHQNPIRAGLVKDLKSWPFSSYLDLAGYRNGTLVDHSLVKREFGSVEKFRKFSERSISI
ncbi:transposase [Fodinibius halophilus]|uniref:Transposase n=1 Tax=Fodinibius halophilus TaxID=1736908 RepID=A0A6M1T608_9BACT|nr:transposase [Fodinibius halophilus]NGP88063.1 transposase [Fodinibius halophilus]